MGVCGKFIDSGLACASSSSQSQRGLRFPEVVFEWLEEGEFRWGVWVSASGHRLPHSSPQLAAPALRWCCWAEVQLEGLGSPSKLQIYLQRSRWALCLWAKEGGSLWSRARDPPFSCIPAGHILDPAVAGGGWQPTLLTPSMAKRGLRIFSLTQWWSWQDLESARLSSNPDRHWPNRLCDPEQLT